MSSFDISNFDDELIEENDFLSTQNSGEEQNVKIIESSTYRSTNSDSISKRSAVDKLCRTENDEIGWIVENDQREETIVVSFETALFINEIHIEETLHRGHINKIEMFEIQQNRWWPMWQRRIPSTESTTKNLFKPILRRYHFKSKTIRISIDPRGTTAIGIRSIKMLGTATFDKNFHQITICNTMNRLYHQTKDLKNTDVQFVVDGKIVGAHRNVLSCRSQYFRTLLSGHFSEGIHRDTIPLTDIDLETLNEILFYIYTGNFHQNLSYDTMVKTMIYCNKINFLPGKNTALENLCRHLAADRSMLLSIYCLAKQMSPAFDLLLDYIYDLSAQHLNEICQQDQFSDLDKSLMIDLVCRAAERREGNST